MSKDNTFGVYNGTSSRCALFCYVGLRVDNSASVTGEENHCHGGNMDVELSARPSTSRGQTGFDQLSRDAVGGRNDVDGIFGDENEAGRVQGANVQHLQSSLEAEAQHSKSKFVVYVTLL